MQIQSDDDAPMFKAHIYKVANCNKNTCFESLLQISPCGVPASFDTKEKMMSQDLKNNAIFVYQGGRSEPLDKKTSFGEHEYVVVVK